MTEKELNEKMLYISNERFNIKINKNRAATITPLFNATNEYPVRGMTQYGRYVEVALFQNEYEIKTIFKLYKGDLLKLYKANQAVNIFDTLANLHLHQNGAKNDI